MHTRWGKVVHQEDFYEDTGRILALESRLRELGIEPRFDEVGNQRGWKAPPNIFRSTTAGPTSITARDSLREFVGVRHRSRHLTSGP